METNKKDWKKAEDAKKDLGTDRTPDEQQKTNAGKAHSSQGHTANAKGTATNTGEPSQRSATTDSSRVPKSSNDDGPTGGNIR